ncbi:MAG: WYL domain-containing protein [Anaeromyxobacteraceae bacterium]
MTAARKKRPAAARKPVAAPRAAPAAAPTPRQAPKTTPARDPRDRLRRVLFLVPYAVRHPGIPVRDLARRCNCSEKELLEDLDFLLGVGSPPFAPDDFLDLYVEGDKVYVALHQSFSRPPRFTESEAAALAAAARALGGDGSGRALKALRDAVPRDRRASFDELVDRIYAGAPPARDSVLGKLHRAIADRRAVELVHRAASGAETARAVRPWTLAQRLGHWYLYGEDVAQGRAKAFRLDRIREVTVGDERFQAPTEAEMAKARLFSDPQGEPVRVRVGEDVVAWAESRPGIRLVRREKGEGAGAVVEIPGASPEWATRFALSLGGDAEVIGPPQARRHFEDVVKRALGRY